MLFRKGNSSINYAVLMGLLFEVLLTCCNVFCAMDLKPNLSSLFSTFVTKALRGKSHYCCVLRIYLLVEPCYFKPHA